MKKNAEQWKRTLHPLRGPHNSQLNNPHTTQMLIKYAFHGLIWHPADFLELQQKVKHWTTAFEIVSKVKK